MNFSYYYNQVPGAGAQRNNLIYTSLISDDQKTFVKWFYNDSDYHKGQNEVVDPEKMYEKWCREIKYITLMSKRFPDLVPEILDIDHKKQKLYLRIDGADFWNRANCAIENYNNVVSNWEQQMITIAKAHKSLGLYKYSMHPSSYFLVDGYLKSINYFFVYHESEGQISIKDHSSHIHSSRQKIVKEQVEKMNISWDSPEDLKTLQHLCFESFRSNYPNNFTEELKKVYD